LSGEDAVKRFSPDLTLSRGRWCAFAALVVSAMMFSSPAKAANPEVALVDDFEHGIPNAMDGQQGRFQSGASRIDVLRDRSIFHGGPNGTSLRIRVDRQEVGHCGVWFQFFDAKAAKKNFLDARPYAFLSFWIRGQVGGERFQIKLADRAWVEREDSLEIGEIRTFLPDGVTRQWQEVLIPLKDAAALDLSNLGGLTLLFHSVGQSTIYIDDISFKTSAAAQSNPNATDNAERQIVRHAAPRTMWLWQLTEFLDNETARESLFDLCAAEGIEQLWVQISYKTDPLSTLAALPNGKPAPARVELRNTDKLRTFLAAAHKTRLQIHALDGDPEYCARLKHSIPLGVVEAILAFNQASPPEQRFDGIHFDNEPHLLLGWCDRTRRERMLKEFLDVHVECQRRARLQSGLAFGVDLPFWWHHIDKQTGRPVAEITFNGKKKPASWHCVDHLDNVGIMNYRDNADGADGMVVNGQDILRYAEETKGARVFMGVETSMSAPTDTWFVVGLPRKRFEAAIRGNAREFGDLCRYEGFRVRRLDDGENIHIGLEIPITPNGDEFARFQRAMKTISDKFGATSQNLTASSIAQLRAAAETAVRVDPELGNFRNRDLANIDRTEIAAFQTTSKMLPKITFGDDSYDKFLEQVKAAENSFRSYKKFGGMAVHSYESFQLLIRRPNIASFPR
jgi:hypothetical protein